MKLKFLQNNIVIYSLLIVSNLVLFSIYQLRFDNPPVDTWIYPYLVAHGLVPVRDFFENHSFLIYYPLSLLAKDQAILHLKILYGILVSINLFLFMRIIQNQTTKLGFYLSTWFYIASTLLMFPSFAHEALIVPCFLVIYYLLLKKSNIYSTLLMSFIAAIASSVKPIAAIILIPIFLFTHNLFIILPTIILWGATIFYLWSQNALHDFYNAFIVFDRNFIPREPLKNFISYIPPVIITIIGLFAVEKKLTRGLIITILFILCSGIFLINSTDPRHFYPLLAFFAIFLAQMFPLLKNKLISQIFMTIFIIYCLFLSIVVINTILPFAFLHKHPPFIYFVKKTDDPYRGRTRALSLKNIIGNKNFFVFMSSDIQETYFYLNKLPPTYYPIYGTFLKESVGDYEKRTIAGLEKNHVAFILNEKPYLPIPPRFPILYKYISSHFTLIKSIEDYELYERSSMMGK